MSVFLLFLHQCYLCRAVISILPYIILVLVIIWWQLTYLRLGKKNLRDSRYIQNDYYSNDLYWAYSTFTVCSAAYEDWHNHPVNNTCNTMRIDQNSL